MSQRTVRVFGVVRTTRGEPVPGAQVTVGESTVHAEPDGSWSIALPAPARRETVACVARAPGFVPSEAHARIETDTLECRVTLELGVAVRFRGRVLQPDGVTPCAGAAVFHALEILGEPEGLGLTDAQGRFDCDDRIAGSDVRAGSYLLALGCDGVGWIWVSIPEETDEWDVRLEPVGVLDVSVRDAQGEPLRAAVVEIVEDWFFDELYMERLGRLAPSSLMPVVRSECDAAGRAALRLPVNRGHWATGGRGYRVRARAEGHLLLERDDVRVGPAGTTRLEFVLPIERTCRVHGAVRDPAGAPVAGASVGSSRTDAEGHFDRSITLDREDTCVIQVTAKGYLRLEHRERVPAGVAERSVSLVLQPALSITGRVVDQHGAAVPGASLTLAHRGDAERTDELGRFRFAPLGPGEHTLRILDLPYGFRRSETTLRVRAGQQDVRVVVTRVEPPRAQLLVAVVEHRTLRPILATRAEVHGLAGSLPSDRIRVLPGRIEATGLWPTFWELYIEADGVAPATVWFTVPDEAATVELRTELGVAGVIAGRLEVDPGCEILLPDQVTVLVQPTTGREAGFGRTPPGIVNLLPRRKRTFRLDQVVPCQPLRLHLLAGDTEVCGSADVVVPPGGEAQVVVRVQRAGKLHLRTEQPLSRGRLHVTGPAGDASPWSDHDVDGPLDHTLPWPPGRSTLEVRLYESVTLRTRRARATCEVTAGSTTEVTLQFVP